MKPHTTLLLVDRLPHLAKSWKNITVGACHVAVQALSISCLDYCSVLLVGQPNGQIQRLQRMQSKASRVIMHAARTVPTTPIMPDLHWLPVVMRIYCKILVKAVLTSKQFMVVFLCMPGTWCRCKFPVAPCDL